MATRPAHIPPQQARSRASLRRMLQAAEVVLDKFGLEGATLPRIAAEAGLSPASVYRRFRDKDALMRAVFSRASEAGAEELAKKMDVERVREIGIRNFAHQWISAMLQGYRTRTGFIRAAGMYAQRHSRAPFVRRQKELEIRNFRKMVQMFLLWRDEIRHPDPEQAVSYGMVTVALTLRELILFDQAQMFENLVPVSDDHLRKELSRVFLRYLGVETDQLRVKRSQSRSR